MGYIFQLNKNQEIKKNGETKFGGAPNLMMNSGFAGGNKRYDFLLQINISELEVDKWIRHKNGIIYF